MQLKVFLRLVRQLLLEHRGLLLALGKFLLLMIYVGFELQSCLFYHLLRASRIGLFDGLKGDGEHLENGLESSTIEN